MRQPPAKRSIEADIWGVRPREATGGRRVALLWASPEAAKVRLIGNSVCPEVAEALVRANVSQVARRARAGGER